MILFIFAIKDSASQAYGSPIFFAAPGVAHRAFSDQVNTSAEDNPLYAHPDDFELHELGVFDTETGRFECLEEPVCRARGKDVSSKYQVQH